MRQLPFEAEQEICGKTAWQALTRQRHSIQSFLQSDRLGLFGVGCDRLIVLGLCLLAFVFLFVLLFGLFLLFLAQQAHQVVHLPRVVQTGWKALIPQPIAQILHSKFSYLHKPIPLHEEPEKHPERIVLKLLMLYQLPLSKIAEQILKAELFVLEKESIVAGLIIEVSDDLSKECVVLAQIVFCDGRITEKLAASSMPSQHGWNTITSLLFLNEPLHNTQLLSSCTLQVGGELYSQLRGWAAFDMLLGRFEHQQLFSIVPYALLEELVEVVQSCTRSQPLFGVEDFQGLVHRHTYKLTQSGVTNVLLGAEVAGLGVYGGGQVDALAGHLFFVQACGDGGSIQTLALEGGARVFGVGGGRRSDLDLDAFLRWPHVFIGRCQVTHRPSKTFFQLAAVVLRRTLALGVLGQWCVYHSLVVAAGVLVVRGDDGWVAGAMWKTIEVGQAALRCCQIICFMLGIHVLAEADAAFDGSAHSHAVSQAGELVQLGAGPFQSIEQLPLLVTGALQKGEVALIELIGLSLVLCHLVEELGLPFQHAILLVYGGSHAHQQQFLVVTVSLCSQLRLRDIDEGLPQTGTQ